MSLALYPSRIARHFICTEPLTLPFMGSRLTASLTPTIEFKPGFAVNCNWAALFAAVIKLQAPDVNSAIARISNLNQAGGIGIAS